MDRVLLVANWDWVLFNFRLPLAAALEKAGYEVILVCPEGPYIDRIRVRGFRVEAWALSRRSLNPVSELLAVKRLHSLYTRLKPGLVHHFTIKPSFYGSAAAICMKANRPRVINTFTGLGFLFSRHKRAAVLRTILMPLLRQTLRQPANWTVFQNLADSRTLLHTGLAHPDRVRLIPGSGVDTNRFRPVERTPKRLPVILTCARLLWDKGIRQVVEAARMLRSHGLPVEFWIAGAADDSNLAAIPKAVLKRWERESVVRFLGHREDISELLQKADIALLPSEHEGLPRFLLEAAASGLPLIATDIPGCRTIVRDGVNGVLVPVRAPHAIAEAIVHLLSDPQRMQQYGARSRCIAEAEYSEERILSQYVDLYRDVCSGPVLRGVQ